MIQILVFVVLLAVDLLCVVIVIPVSITSIRGFGHLDSRVLGFGASAASMGTVIVADRIVFSSWCPHLRRVCLSDYTTRCVWVHPSLHPNSINKLFIKGKKNPSDD